MHSVESVCFSGVENLQCTECGIEGKDIFEGNDHELIVSI
jgi:hypothetical protein